jgi:hypothetical protein
LISPGPQLELELWHPSGVAPRRLSLGALAPPATGSADAAEAELVVVAPAADELDGAWLVRSLIVAARRVSHDGLVWIVVPRRRRAAAEKAARRTGLHLIGAVMTVPAWPETAHFIPVDRHALRDAGVRHLGLDPRAARLLGALASHALLRRALPGCALLAARRPAPAAFAWLGAAVGTATVSGGPQANGRVATVLRFPPGAAAPDLVVKAALDPGGERRLQREAEALARLGGPARAAGAAIPATRPAHAPWLLGAEALRGRPAAALLARRPGRLGPVAMSVARWLTTWNRTTARTVDATPALLERMLLAPAAHVQHAGAADPGYVDALRRLAARLEDTSLLATAAHNDLTMANVYVSPGGIGVIDWETASGDGLPLTDLWYALADGVARAARVSHARAVRALVDGGPPAPRALARTPAEHAARLALNADQARLGFHCCWLQHADTELSRGLRDGRFLAVVSEVSAARLLWPG